jgi:hypothetical protein
MGVYALNGVVIAWGGGLGSLGSMLCNNRDVSTIEQNEGGILGRTQSDRDERKQRKIYDMDRPGIPVFGSESGKALRGFCPAFVPNFVPTSRHMALSSSARPSSVNDDHGLPVVSVTMNANSTGLVIGEKAAVMIADSRDDCRGVWEKKLGTHTEGFENTQR